MIWRSLRYSLGRLRLRLLLVNLVLVLVPMAGLEFADVYESQLLRSLERDMRNQAVLVRRTLESDLRRDIPLDDPAHERTLQEAAQRTRTRIRIIDRRRAIVADSHRQGPPEGPEPYVGILGSRSADFFSPNDYSRRRNAPRWAAPANRPEVNDAFRGAPSSRTRVRDRHPEVLLFLTEPIMPRRRVSGVVYVVRSTQPVLAELHRIRTGLVYVMAVAFALTFFVTLVLAWSISRPLSRLSKAAKRIAAGERDVKVPIAGSGEVRELGEAFASMTEELQRRLGYASDFAADVAHEFKSPLTAIRGAAELLEEGAADDPKARQRFLRNILIDTERLDRLVSRLLQLGRIEATATAKDVVVPQAMLEAIAERCSDEKNSIELSWNATAPLLPARRGDLETALLNLVENAKRFSPDGAPVRIEVEDSQLRGKAAIAFRISDKGPGIAPENRERVFSRFFTTDAAKQGTGLGLAIAKAVAENHGGTLTLLETTKGAAFEMRLPLTRS